MKQNTSDSKKRNVSGLQENLNKALVDCMTALDFWADDAQVVSEIIEKFWANTPGIYIRVDILQEEK